MNYNIFTHVGRKREEKIPLFIYGTESSFFSRNFIPFCFICCALVLNFLIASLAAGRDASSADQWRAAPPESKNALRHSDEK